ncbi:MAG: hypothetical protein ACJ72Z_09580 [Pyrinomonadaceae bacterium]
MSRWVAACSLVYRRVSRAFPREYRAVCGDGLERLGADVIPLIWDEQGILGLAKCFADLAASLPVEYFSAWVGKLKESIMNDDLFEGTWKANNENSKWDPSYTPEEACLRFEPTEDGYLLVAYGIKDGQPVAERPTPIFADGRRRPIVDLNGRPIPGVPPGAVSFGTQPDPRTIESGAEADGEVLGKGTYQVSDDGQTLTVTTEGTGLKGPFKVVAVFDRVVPDPYLPQS